MNAKRVVSTDPRSPVPADVVAILETVIEERDRAMQKWGVQTHPDGTGGKAAEVLRDAAIAETEEAAANGTVTWKKILLEEVREAFAETDLVALDNELMQVMQVCCVWREDLRRRMAAVAVDPAEEALVENEMRTFAGKFPQQPALKSLANGYYPGRRWMIDNVRSLLVTTNSETEDGLGLQRLLSWVNDLPSNWWDSNFVKEEHDAKVSEALEAQKEQDAAVRAAREESGGASSNRRSAAWPL